LEFGAEAYSIEFFRREGYIRQRCGACGKFFWSQVHRENCGEAPCSPYTFIGNPPTRRRYSIGEMRREFLRYFELHNHAVIKPYPVVPRWRKDLYLVSASIVDFQPHVTSGATEPPANPLVVSQPCIRLVDLDKVGLTFGRHMTIFEMGGAHAFNSPSREVYWKDRTVELCLGFMEGLGLDRQDIVFKEGVWSGGGNAGPCYEVIHGGLEVATLVFMSYKTLDGGLEEMPYRTVDTGYGIERYTWLSQGTTSAFSSVYQDLFRKFAELLEVPPEEDERLQRYAKYSAWIQPGGGITASEARMTAARLAGVEIGELLPTIERLETLYKALDHTKSIAFILSDGVVPSNSKVGYLARLLIRRIVSILTKLGGASLLPDLVSMQIEYWGADFPHLKEMKDEVIELVTHEVNKFGETLSRGMSFLEKELAEISRGTKTLTPDYVAKLYEEKGLTPDIVVSAAAKAGLQAPSPEEVEELMVSRHMKAVVEKEEDDIRLRNASRIVKGLPKTERLYYEDPYAFKFNAKVLASANGVVVLDRTLFYPEGGGQVGDTGTLSWDGGTAKVIDTQIVDGVVVHIIEGPQPPAGVVVTGEIDHLRRLSIMRHHTATHILIGAARRVLGRHAWQMGAKKEAEVARLDISHHKPLTVEEIERIELLANETVSRRIPVRTYWLQRSVAEERYGFTLYQGGEAPLGEVRVVEIPGWDAEACGGTHCANSAEVGLIKILRVERIQDGVVRLVFTAGPKTLGYINQRLAELQRRVERLSEEESRLRLGYHKLIEIYQTRLLEKIRSAAEYGKSANLERLFDELHSMAAKIWSTARFYQKEEYISGVRVVFDFRPVADPRFFRALALEAVSHQQPSLSVIAGQSGEGLLVALALNKKAAEKGLSLENSVSELSITHVVEDGKGVLVGVCAVADPRRLYERLAKMVASLQRS
jgi:alanyl-tRNA synthetase